jgi:hypothetical protein
MDASGFGKCPVVLLFGLAIFGLKSAALLAILGLICAALLAIGGIGFLVRFIANHVKNV